METSDVPRETTAIDLVSWRRTLINQSFIPLSLEIFKTITIGGSDDLPQYKSEHQRTDQINICLSYQDDFQVV